MVVLSYGLLLADSSPPDYKSFRSQAGFLQVRENWKKSGNLSGQGKVRGKYFLEKSGKMVPPDVSFSG